MVSESVRRPFGVIPVKPLAACAAGVAILAGVLLVNAARIGYVASQRDAQAAEATKVTAAATAQAVLTAKSRALAVQIDQRCGSSVVFKAQNGQLCVDAAAFVNESQAVTGCVGDAVSSTWPISGRKSC